MSSGEDDIPYIHCSLLPSRDLLPSRFPHLNAWIREYYRELQVRTDDEMPADSYDMYTLKVHTGRRPFICDFGGC
ncbi:hypothetical protein, partial [Sansalvadorimonas verongulae]|uniref:hypothetical protein n=1 Tax=Sansalvadorimonas verongulae TaxID=2172824 RepID=UPI001E3BD109